MSILYYNMFPISQYDKFGVILFFNSKLYAFLPQFSILIRPFQCTQIFYT